MKYSFKAIQHPDLPPFETLAFAGGGNHTQGNGRIGTAAPVEATSPQLTRPTRAGLPSDSAPARPNPSEPAQASLLSGSAFGQLQHQRAGQQLPHAARHRQRDASETFSQHADVEGRQSPLAG